MLPVFAGMEPCPQGLDVKTGIRIARIHVRKKSLLVPGRADGQHNLPLVRHEVEVSAMGVDVHAPKVDSTGAAEHPHGLVAETINETAQHGPYQPNTLAQNGGIAAVHVRQGRSGGNVVGFEAGQALSRR